MNQNDPCTGIISWIKSRRDLLPTVGFTTAEAQDDDKELERFQLGGRQQCFECTPEYVLKNSACPKNQVGD